MSLERLVEVPLLLLSVFEGAGKCFTRFFFPTSSTGQGSSHVHFFGGGVKRACWNQR